MTDIDHAAERVRNLTAIDAAFANFMADSSFDSAEEMLRFIDWFDTPGRVPSGWDLTRYARAKMALSYAAQAAELAELRAKLEAAEKERDQANGYYEKCIELNSEASDKNERLHRENGQLRTAAAPFEDGSEITVEWCLANGAKHLTNDIYRWRFPGRPVVEWSAKSGRTFMHERCIGTLDLGAMNHLLASLKPGGVK